MIKFLKRIYKFIDTSVKCTILYFLPHQWGIISCQANSTVCQLFGLSQVLFNSIQLLSHFQLCDPMDCSTPGFPVHHQLSELAQTHVHWVGDAIQPSHPLSSPSPPAFSLSQHQGLFNWVSFSHQVAKILDLQLQHQFFQLFEYSGLISFRIDWFDLFAVQRTLKSLLQHHS